MPPVKLPAIPSAQAVFSASSPSILAAAAAAPKLPQVPVECQPPPVLWARYPPAPSSTRKATS